MINIGEKFTLHNCHPYSMDDCSMDDNYEEWVKSMGVASGHD